MCAPYVHLLLNIFTFTIEIVFCLVFLMCAHVFRSQLYNINMLCVAFTHLVKHETHTRKHMMTFQTNSVNSYLIVLAKHTCFSKHVLQLSDIKNKNNCFFKHSMQAFFSRIFFVKRIGAHEINHRSRWWGPQRAILFEQFSIICHKLKQTTEKTSLYASKHMFIFLSF